MGHRSSRRDRGASAVEYGLLLAGIAAIIVVAVYGFGDVVNKKLFETSCAQITSAVGSGSCH